MTYLPTYTFIKRCLLLIGVFLITPDLISQDVNKASLLKVLDTTTTVPMKVQLYADLAWEYVLEESDSAIMYADRALQLSRKNDYFLGEAIALETKGIFYEVVVGNYDLASQFYFDGIKICEENNLNYDASIYHSLGVMFHTSDSYEKALNYYTEAYNLALKYGDSILQKKCLINLGAINSSLENFKKAEDFMIKSLELEISPEMDYTTFANLGYLYVKQEDFTKALPYLEKSIEQIPDNSASELNLYMYLHAKAKAQDTSNMQGVLKRAKEAINTVGLRDKSLLLRNIADYYASTKDYKSALKYRDEYITVFEEIKEKQRDQTVLDLETKYQVEKKDFEIEKQKTDKKLLIWIISFIGILLISTILFYFKIKGKNKLLAKQKLLLEKTVNAKNILLRETHHRVKNSFQIVSSLLYLQSENVDDTEAKIAIKEAENRVRSMILIHQKLYNKDELVGINVQEYIQDLTTDIIESHISNPDSIKTKLNIEPLVLNIETITPFGLILNELVTNVIKHAYTDINHKVLKIDLKQEKNQLVLKVIDNGKGLQAKPSDTSFGITLMKALSKKLKATIDIKQRIDSQGAIATLTMNRFQILT